ncbi:MAG: winged helix-turn-helix domain-containing protein [Xanthomonadales bacterium]
MGTGYCLGEWTVRPHRNQIQRGDRIVHLAPKAMAVLDCLVRAENSVVTRQEIFDTVWPGAAITDEALTQQIADLRKAFGDSAQHPKIIETIPKVGFRLIPQVATLPEETGTRPELRRAGPTRAFKWLLPVTLGLLVVALALRQFLPIDPENRTPPPRAENPVVAVLPFVNMSGDPDDEYFSDGISEELINLLAKVPGLDAISRTSSFSFKGERVKITDIARELNASLIVEGTVRKVGEKVRITAQLIDPGTDRHLWSESYDRELSDIFRLQEEIAQSIVTALQDRIGAQNVIGPRPTENLEAYELFLAGRHYFYQRGTALDSASRPRRATSRLMTRPTSILPAGSGQGSRPSTSDWRTLPERRASRCFPADAASADLLTSKRRVLTFSMCTGTIRGWASRTAVSDCFTWRRAARILPLPSWPEPRNWTTRIITTPRPVC